MRLIMAYSKEEMAACVKAWREANKEKVRAYLKAYREANKDKIKVTKKAYREANKDKIKVTKKAYHEANKDKIVAKVSAYYWANKDKHKATIKAYREANKEKVAATKKAWAVANADKVTADVSRRKALKLKLIPKHLKNCPVEKQRVLDIFKLCRLISMATGVKHHVDHMWPVSDGGPEWSGNLQIITAYENVSKGASVDLELKHNIQQSLKETM
jgi:hypothetical protein